MVELVPVNDADYQFSDGSMNARQYHAWLWAKVPKDVTGEKLQRVTNVINRLTLEFMAGALDDPPHNYDPPGQGLSSLIK